MNGLNIKSSTIEKALELATKFLQNLVGPSVKEMGLLLGDNVKLWRLKNQLRNFEIIKKKTSAKNIKFRKIDLKVLLPYLDGVSLEEDELLHEKWANLITNYIDSKKNLTITVYPNILKQLSTNEIKIIDWMSTNRSKFLYNEFHPDFKENKVEFTNSELANLERLGIIREVVEIWKFGFGDDNYEERASNQFYLTNFGDEFVAACNT